MRKGKSFCPGLWGNSICIPDTLLVLGVSTCLPHMKGGSAPGLRCRDPKAPVLGGVLPQNRGSNTCGCCNGELCGRRKSWHQTTRLLVPMSLGRREELCPFCCSISLSLGISLDWMRLQCLGEEKPGGTLSLHGHLSSAPDI